MSIYLLIAIAVVIIIGLVSIPKHYPYLEKEPAPILIPPHWKALSTGKRIIIHFRAFDEAAKSLNRAAKALNAIPLPEIEVSLPKLKAEDELRIQEALREAAKGIYLQPSIGGGIFIEDNPYFEYYEMFLSERTDECNTEEFTPFEAGRIAYGLGRGEEDNPYRDNEELGIEWEAGYCEAFRLDREDKRE